MSALGIALFTLQESEDNWHRECKEMAFLKMHLPLIDNLARPNGSKILWVVCDNFEKASIDGSGKTSSDPARTPNLDGLSGESDTGLLEMRIGPKEPSVDFDSIAHLSSLEIKGKGGRSMLGRLLGSAQQDVREGLIGVERKLEAHWNDYDFFVLRLNPHRLACDLDGDLDRIEWMEMLDAWLPGLFASFMPQVFALSGDLWAGDGAAISRDQPAPLMLHSGKSRGTQTKGFTLECCRKGRLGKRLSLRHGLLLLLAHAERLDEVVIGDIAVVGEATEGAKDA